MRYFAVLFLSLVFAGGCKMFNHSMTQDEMEGIVRKVGSQVQGNHGWITFTYGGVPMALVSDPSHDRMRIVAPVKKVSELTPQQKDAIMEANFHTALDARYASSEGVLYAAYIHPLSPLTEGELKSALSQVANLVKTFGTTYAGGDLVFKGSARQQ